MSSRKGKTLTTEERLRRAMKFSIAAVRQFALVRDADQEELEPIRELLSKGYRQCMDKLTERERRRRAREDGVQA